MITQLLHEARAGSDEAERQLWQHVYDELRRIARGRLVRQHAEGLDTTGLVHEAYLKLADGEGVDWKDRSHFYAVASRAMRFIVIDAARRQTAGKRGGQAVDASLDDVQIVADQRAEDVLALDEALEMLTERDERLGRLVELKFFGGLTFKEIGNLLDRSERTVKRDWTRARLWLHRFMSG
ncbi:MAG: ECF-type sigma factor [Bacteroidota bacterium]